MAYSWKPSVDCAKGSRTPRLLKGGWRKLLPRVYEVLGGTGRYTGGGWVEL